MKRDDSCKWSHLVGSWGYNDIGPSNITEEDHSSHIMPGVSGGASFNSI